VAERKRRDEEPADELLDEELFDDAAEDDGDDDFVDTDVDDDLDEDVSVSRGRRGTATKARAKADKPVKKDTTRTGIFGRVGRFVREVVAELRKVIWPTRKELVTYTSVVIVFVTMVIVYVTVLDFGFSKAVFQVFG